MWFIDISKSTSLVSVALEFSVSDENWKPKEIHCSLLGASCSCILQLCRIEQRIHPTVCRIGRCLTENKTAETNYCRISCGQLTVGKESLVCSHCGCAQQTPSGSGHVQEERPERAGLRSPSHMRII